MAATVSKSPTSSSGVTEKRRMWIGIAGGGAVALTLVVWGLISIVGGGEPRLNENSVVLTRFIRSGDFDELPYEKQRQFYKVLDDRKDEIDQLYKDRRLSEAEYRTALEAAWLGKHINRVEKYYSLPPGAARDGYIDKLLDKKAKKGTDADDDEPGKIKTDETAAELKVETWPPAVREQWKTFHATYSREKKAREAVAGSTKPAKK
jgi:hypothetical protein